METIELGHGDRVVLVHGDVFDAEATWSAQGTLAADHRLVLVNRRGFGRSPDVDGEDFALDADDVATILGPGAHPVGNSYGGVVALLTAAAHPELVRSLAVFEPPAFGLVPERSDVRQFRRTVEELVASRPTPEEFLRQFVIAVGGDPGRLPTPLRPALVKAASVQMHGRFPWEAQMPLDVLAHTPFPKLVVSGDHSKMFDAVCDVLKLRLRARREVLSGAGHSIPLLGEPVNDALTALWRESIRS